MSDINALLAKVHGMRRKLLTTEELESRNTLESWYDYLSTTKDYAEAIKSYKASSTSTPEMIQATLLGVRFTFLRLYHFYPSPSMKVFGIPFETRYIRRVLQSAEDHGGKPEVYVNAFTDYLGKVRHYDISGLINATNMQEVLNAFSRTEFAPFFRQYRDLFGTKSFRHAEVQAALSQFEDGLILHDAKKYFSSDENRLFLNYFGSELDLLNLQILYRLKFYYETNASDIEGQLYLPSRKLKTDVVIQLLNANDPAAFRATADSIGLGEAFDPTTGQLLPSQDFKELIFDRGRKYSRFLSDSVFSVMLYLSEKEQEANAIVRQIEILALKQQRQNNQS